MIAAQRCSTETIHVYRGGWTVCGLRVWPGGWGVYELVGRRYDAWICSVCGGGWV